MTQNIVSIIEKRKQLGWTLNVLAEKTNIAYSTLRRIEDGITTGMDDYIDWIEITLNKALNIPYKKWSQKYERCIKCGTTQTKHVSRGLCKNCYEKDIEKRHKVEDRIRNYGGSSSILTIEYLLENYVKYEKSLGEIARETNCSRQYVYKRMREYGVPLRSKTESRILALEQSKVIFERIDENGNVKEVTLQKNKLNENFFKGWSNQMAYVLGVIYTDGNLRSGVLKDPASSDTLRVGRLTVSQKEPELLQKILNLMECDAKLLFRKREVFKKGVAGQLYYFHINNDGVYDDLIALGLLPNKSLTMKFPDVPREYVRHFVRGCWDGDGSVYFEKRDNRIKASYVSGSKKFIEAMVGALRDDGFLIKTIYTNKSKTPSYYFRLNTSEMPAFYKYLYDNVPDTQYLKRKYNLFKLSSERL
jgi:transcriptional regulator with XRE-family HTH domain